MDNLMHFKLEKEILLKSFFAFVKTRQVKQIDVDNRRFH